MTRCRFAFCASTGRTATMFLARTLNELPGVIGLHEGHEVGDPPSPRLPLINLQNRAAWHDPAVAERTVATSRAPLVLTEAAGEAHVLVDIAFYNSPLLVPLMLQYPDSIMFAIFRRCADFVRSATIVSGEDRQPAGWPDRAKPLTDRERFVSLGRLKPDPRSEPASRWSGWSAIERNIWLWHTVNSHLLRVVRSGATCRSLRYEDLAERPRVFWTDLLDGLTLLSGSNLERCVRASERKLNQRTSYQIGLPNTWSDAELALYEQLAQPLERELYD